MKCGRCKKSSPYCQVTTGACVACDYGWAGPNCDEPSSTTVETTGQLQTTPETTGELQTTPPNKCTSPEILLLLKFFHTQKMYVLGMTLNYNRQSYSCSVIQVGKAQFNNVEVSAEMPMTQWLFWSFPCKKKEMPLHYAGRRSCVVQPLCNDQRF